MELKFLSDLSSSPSISCFNRTRMELKSIFKPSVPGISLCFNRTRMELKFWHNLYQASLRCALIVPEWN